MDELLAKDAAFFHDNFAGSLTKRVLSFAARFEDFADTLMFNVVGNLVPLAFASVVLWHHDPLLVAGLIGLIVVAGAILTPLIRRRQRLVDEREEVNAHVSGRVADSIANMETIRAFAAEDREAAEHRLRVAELKHKSLRSWDYHNLRIDLLVSTYRQLESSLTEAAQFTELLLAAPTVTDPVAPESLRPRASDVRFEHVTFAHVGGSPLFADLDLVVPNGTRLGLVGRSGGGKTTLTRLLLRMMDIDEGRILIGGQDISKLRQSDLQWHQAMMPSWFSHPKTDMTCSPRGGLWRAD